MADTIESFVSKLQQEGVEAGRAEAEKLKADAQAQADEILADAKKQAEKIVADANKEAEAIVSRGKTDLQLAARDTVAQLRSTLSDCMTAVLAEGAKEKLTDLDFLGKVMHEIVRLYAEADKAGKTNITLDVPAEHHQQLKEWAFSELKSTFEGETHPHLDFKGRLQQAGFEYEVDGGKVEVTLESMVATLSGMVTPALREVLQKAAQDSSAE
jgi:V/A-type H+-transporting ATPase subunit E